MCSSDAVFLFIIQAYSREAGQNVQWNWPSSSVPQTVAEHQLYGWIVNQEVTVQIDAKIQGGSWYMVGAHYTLEWMNN